MQDYNEMLQFLDKDGKLSDDAPDIAHQFDTLLKLYKAMVTIRTFDHKAIALQRTGKMGTYPSILGSETVSVIAGAVLDKNDVFAPYYRDQGTQYLRGVTLTEMFQFWGGDERGNNFHNCKYDFPCSVPIASQALHAVGAAFALKHHGKNNCALVSLGDGATSQGDFYEAMNAAGALKLPVVFLICNNKFAISTPIEKQTFCKTLAQKSIAGGFDGLIVDGNDPIASYYVVKQAIEKAKKESIPVLIEAITYRLSDHTTADDALRYRTQEELDNAWLKDGVNRLKNYLIKNSIINQHDVENILSDAKTEVKEAVEKYLQIQLQDVEDLFDYHYANIPTILAEQKMELKNV